MTIYVTVLMEVTNLALQHAPITFFIAATKDISLENFLQTESTTVFVTTMFAAMDLTKPD